MMAQDQCFLCDFGHTVRYSFLTGLLMLMDLSVGGPFQKLVYIKSFLNYICGSSQQLVLLVAITTHLVLYNLLQDHSWKRLVRRIRS